MNLILICLEVKKIGGRFYAMRSALGSLLVRVSSASQPLYPAGRVKLHQHYFTGVEMFTPWNFYPVKSARGSHFTGATKWTSEGGFH